MSLIRCSECGKEISDQAQSCPNCGKPNNKVVNDTESSGTSKTVSTKKSSGKAGLVIFIALTCLTLLCVGQCVPGLFSARRHPVVNPVTPAPQSPSATSQSVHTTQTVAEPPSPPAPVRGESSEFPVILGDYVVDSRNFPSSTCRLRVNEVIRGDEAYARLLQENQFTLSPDDGNEFILVLVEAEYPNIASNEGSIDFMMYGAKMYYQGQLVDSMINLIMEPSFGSIELLPGGRATGWLWFEIPCNWSSPLLMMGANIFTDENGIFMSIQ